MHIFVDEAGIFVRSATKPHSVSCVGALVIPDNQLVRVEGKFDDLKRGLRTKGGEVKGSRLNEREIAAVIDLLVKNDLIFEVTFVDMAVHSDDEITRHKLVQADKLLEHLTDEHQPSAIAQAGKFAAQLRGLPNQLYCQMVATITLINRVLENSTMYYSQRQPKELANFHWIIDGKSPDGVTIAEELWKNLIAPFLQSASLREPMKTFAEGDYSYFDDKYVTKMPEYLREHGFHNKDGINISKIMWEDIHFFRSDDCLCLQLVDVLVNAIRRAFVGNLQHDGWRDLSRLMIRVNGQSVQMISLGADPEPVPNAPYANVVRLLNRNNKEMLAPRFRSRLFS